MTTFNVYSRRTGRLIDTDCSTEQRKSLTQSAIVVRQVSDVCGLSLAIEQPTTKGRDPYNFAPERAGGSSC